MSNTGPMSCPHHPRTPLEQKTFRKPYKCEGCYMDGIGPRYRCKDCDYELHNECMFPSQKFTPWVLQGHVFEFKNRPPPPPVTRCSKPNCTEHKRFCDACGMAVNGFVYHCVEKGFDLHPCCAMLGRGILIEGVEFRLDKERKPRKCDWCSAKRVEGSVKEFPGWSYVSSDYNYHVFCIMDMAVQSSKLISTSDRNIYGIDQGDYNLALEKLDLPPIVKKRRNGVNGNKYWRILKVLISTVLSIVFGDPTTILAKLAVESVVQLLS